MVTMAERKKKLNEELQVINNSVLGKQTIESAAVFKDLGPGNNSRESLYSIIKDLYKFSKKVISLLDESPSKEQPRSPVTADDINSLVKKQLTEVLPGLLKEALENHGSITKTTTKVVKDKEPIKRHMIVIEKKEDEEDEEKRITEQTWSTVVSKDVKKTLKTVPVIKAQATDGAAKLQFKSEADMSRAHEALKTKYKVTSSSKTQEVKKLDPKLTISDLHSGIKTAEELENLIIEKNDFIKELREEGETLKVVFLDKKGGQFAVIRVSPKLREAIRDEGDKIFLDLQQHHVRDRIHVIQCYHCQGYAHTTKSPFCKQKDSTPTCFYCAGSHRSDSCNKKDKEHKCANCAKSNNRAERLKCTTHKASDTLCPFYVREKLKIMARTPGCEESKNVYHQKVKEHQRRLGRA